MFPGREFNRTPGEVSSGDQFWIRKIWVIPICALTYSFSRNIEKILDPISKIESLSGFAYNLIGETSRTVGVSAQDVKEVLREAVSLVDGEHFGVDYAQLIPLLIEAIKEQQVKIDRQNEETKI